MKISASITAAVAARLNKITVNEFAIGMGPKLFGKQKGDTLYSIAKEYSVPYEIINELNMLPDPSKLSIGQAIIVRIPSELYKVRRGDTLFSVSRKFAIPEKTLLRNNPKLMGLDDLTEGEELVIHYEDPDPIKSFAEIGRAHV